MPTISRTDGHASGSDHESRKSYIPSGFATARQDQQKGRNDRSRIAEDAVGGSVDPSHAQTPQEECATGRNEADQDDGDDLLPVGCRRAALLPTAASIQRADDAIDISVTEFTGVDVIGRVPL